MRTSQGSEAQRNNLVTRPINKKSTERCVFIYLILIKKYNLKNKPTPFVWTNNFYGGADQTRTDDPLHAMQMLYQLSYNPMRVIYFIFLLAKCQIILLTFYQAIL